MMGDDGARARCGPAKTGVSSFTAGHEGKSEKKLQVAQRQPLGRKNRREKRKKLFLVV